MTTKPDTLHLDAILEAYCSNASKSENLIDILADVMRWCLLNGVEFEELLTSALSALGCRTSSLSQSASKTVPEESTSRKPAVVIAQLLDLAQKIDDFADEQTECLSFDDYSALCEQQTKLMAYANLLGNFDADSFLRDELLQAECLFTAIRKLLGPNG